MASEAASADVAGTSCGRGDEVMEVERRSATKAMQLWRSENDIMMSVYCSREYMRR